MCLFVLRLIRVVLHLQWNTVGGSPQGSVKESRIPLQGTQVTLTAMQIRTFIVKVGK